jgi:enoyl-CoA hydratase/carnithine racemase
MGNGDTGVRSVLEDGVLVLTLDRPSKKNALTRAMYRALTDGLGRASADGAVRVVHLRGEGGAFTAGNDLMDFMEDPPGPEGGPVVDFLRALVAFDKPLLAEVAGPAIGIGTTMLLHCDLVLVADTAKLRMPFTTLGLCPEAGASLLLPQLVGRLRANALLMLADTISGTEAAAIGLANRAVPAAELPDAARSMALRLAELPLPSLLATKALMRRAHAPALADVMHAELGVFAERLRSPEAMEAMQAFFEKRPPDFRQFS